MRTIYFDLLCSQAAKGYKFHGGGEYTKMVFRYYVERKKENDEEIYALYNTAEFIDDWIKELCIEHDVKIVHVNSTKMIAEVLSNSDSTGETRFFAGMVYPYNNIVFPSYVYSVGTCHGLRPIEKPTDKYRLAYYNVHNESFIDVMKELTKNILVNYSLRRYHKLYSSEIKPFKTIVTDSNHSLFSIRLNFPEYADKEIKVLYPMTQGIKNGIMNSEVSDGKYLMMISANRWTKNCFRAIQAIDGLYKKGLLDGYRTRVYGNMPIKLRKKMKYQEMFDFFEYVSSEELEKAYSECSVFLYPTLNEGFGNVPMEAMKYGKTCVVSAVCSLPEVYQNSVIYCNPYDIMEIQNRILQALENKIDRTLINERLEYLYQRQKKDMEILCSIISGERICFDG